MGVLATAVDGLRIAVLGIPSDQTMLDLSALVFGMTTLKGIYGCEMYETWDAMSVLLQSGLRNLRDHHRPLRRGRPRGSVRRGPARARRQGDPALVVSSLAAAVLLFQSVVAVLN